MLRARSRKRQRRWMVTVLLLGGIVTAGTAARADEPQGTTHSCMEGFWEAAQECFSFSAVVLEGADGPTPPDHPRCDTYPCTIRFYMNCGGVGVGAQGDLERTDPGAEPTGTDQEFWKTDPWITTSHVPDHTGRYFVDWVVTEDDVDPMVWFHHTDVRIFRSGSTVLSPPLSITLH